MQATQRHTPTRRAKTGTLILFVCALICCLAGCGNPQASARKELLKSGKDVSPAGFLESAAQGDNDAVALFLQAGFDVRTTDAQGLSALDYAAMSGNTNLVQLLLDHGADPNAAIASGEAKGGTPLMTAVLGGHRDVVEQLLAHGARVNTRDAHGLTPWTTPPRAPMLP